MKDERREKEKEENELGIKKEGEKEEKKVTGFNQNHRYTFFNFTFCRVMLA